MSQSENLFAKACESIPGGVNSPVRAFNGVGGTPVFIERGDGPYLFDADGNRYIDYVGSWGPMILGHSHPAVIKAVMDTASRGLSFGAPTEIEVRLADKVCELMPSVDLVRMTCSGTEATMSAIRLARGFTGRDRIIKFEGCYHGHSDSLLVKAGSGALTLGVPNSPGVPAALAEYTVTLEFNNSEQVKAAFDQMGDQIACVIVEPIAGNMNCVPPESGFLQTLRECCDRSGTVLIFDEVMTGFRVALGGAQQVYGVTPDLTTLGKVIGGGMPVGAFGGKKEIMGHIAPLGPVYQAGTLAGNPVAMVAGLTTLDLISSPGFFDELSAKCEKLVTGMLETASKHGVAMSENHVGGMFGLFFTDQDKVSRFSDVSQCDIELFKRFFHGMLDRGVNLAPSAFEAGFISIAHSDDDIAATLAAADETIASL